MNDFGVNSRNENIFAAILGPLTSRPGIEQGGHFIQVGVCSGFYIPEADYQLALDRANESGKVQFVGLAKNGSGIHATREALHVDPNCDGYIAWIFPEASNGKS